MSSEITENTDKPSSEFDSIASVTDAIQQNPSANDLMIIEEDVQTRAESQSGITIQPTETLLKENSDINNGNKGGNMEVDEIDNSKEMPEKTSDVSTCTVTLRRALIHGYAANDIGSKTHRSVSRWYSMALRSIKMRNTYKFNCIVLLVIVTLFVEERYEDLFPRILSHKWYPGLYIARNFLSRLDIMRYLLGFFKFR